MTTRQLEKVPNYWKALGHQPEFLAATWQKLKTVMGDGALDRRTKEIMVIAGTATVSAFVSGILWNLGPYTNYFFYASVGTIAVCLVYVVLCVGGSVYFRRIAQRYNPLVHGLIPVIGIAVFGLAVYGSVYGGAIPPAPYTFVPYVNLGWLVLGIAFVIYLSRNAPEKIGQIGSILGEEGGEVAGILDQPSPSPATS
jgi:hypothetical protein